MLPNDIGCAAAYEVWRNWRSHYGVYAQPLAGDRERQREALIGLAVGEGEYPYNAVHCYNSFVLKTVCFREQISVTKQSETNSIVLIEYDN